MDFFQFLFPRRCIFCQKVLELDLKQKSDAICSDCFKSAPFIETACPKCGGVKNCGCAYEHHVFSRNVSLFYYTDLSREAIRSMKYDGRRDIGTELGNLIIKYGLFGGDFFNSINLVTSVPVHKNRKKERGYNQCDAIAKAIAKHRNIKFEADILTRIKDTPPQYGVSYSGRKENVKGAFSLNKNKTVKNLNILLVDDIFTSGATINECGKTLKENGAGMIFSVTAAKAEKQARYDD